MSPEKLQNISDGDLINRDDFIDKLPPGFGGPGDQSAGYLIDYIRRLMEIQRRLKKATNISSTIMIILTIVLLILTGVLVLQGF